MVDRGYSFLVADLGSVTTRAALIEPVAGEHRVVAHGQAPSTTLPPWENAGLALSEAIGQIQDLRGHRLLKEEGSLLSPEEGGPQGFWVTASGASPLRTLLLSLASDRIVKILLRTISSAYARAEEVLDFRALRMGRAGVSTILPLLSRRSFDLILLVGGSDVAAQESLMETGKDLVAFLVALRLGKIPPLLYLGDPQAIPLLRGVLGGLVRMEVVDDPPPDLEEEDLGGLSQAVEKLWVEEQLLTLPGIEKVSSWSKQPIHPSSRGFGWVGEFLAQRDNKVVFGLDLGASSTTVVRVAKGKKEIYCEEVGLGQGLKNLLALRNLALITRGLPSSLSSQEAEEYLRNKAIRPHILAQTESQLLLEQGAAREAISLVWEKIREDGSPAVRPDLILAAGSYFSRAITPQQVILTLLDGLPPLGVATLALDRLDILPTLGALIQDQPSLAPSVLLKDGLQFLGTMVTLSGRGKRGATVLTFKVVYPSGEQIEGELGFGGLETIPLTPWQLARVQLIPQGRVAVGWGTPGEAITVDAPGGEMGLIIDARGRGPG